MLSLLLKPKVLGALGIVLALVTAGITIKSKITSYGKAQYAAGVKACEDAVRAKAKEARDNMEDLVDLNEEDAKETETVFVEVIKEVAVTDATIVAENEALKYQINLIYEGIENAHPDNSACGNTDVPDDSLQIHNTIDRHLSGD